MSNIDIEISKLLSDVESFLKEYDFSNSSYKKDKEELLERIDNLTKIKTLPRALSKLGDIISKSPISCIEKESSVYDKNGYSVTLHFIVEPKHLREPILRAFFDPERKATDKDIDLYYISATNHNGIQVKDIDGNEINYIEGSSSLHYPVLFNSTLINRIANIVNDFVNKEFEKCDNLEEDEFGYT